MKVVILAGGYGTRMAEEADTKPKPMVDVGGKPLIWHIMKLYSHHGFKDFVICLGYKGYVIKEFFLNYHVHMADVSVDLGTGRHTVLNSEAEDWRVTMLETGETTMTGGRLKRVLPHLGDETFCLTYGDGLADIDLGRELAFHKAHGKLATVAAVRPPGRFGVLRLGEDESVTEFAEKPQDEVGWINGGFFILDPGVGQYIRDDFTSWEKEPLAALAGAGELAAFRHEGFWQPCDTLRDKRLLDSHWQAGDAPWAIWT